MRARPLLFSFIAATMVMAALLAQPASAASVGKFARAQAINWQGQVVNAELVMPFYQRRFFKGIWTTDNGLTKRGQELIQILSAAASDGLEPRDYLGGLPGDVNAMRGDDLAAAELYLSEASVRFSRDLFAGRTTPSISEPDIVIARKQLDITALLGSFDKNGVEKVIAQLRPSHEQYLRLRKLLAGTSNDATRRKIVTNMERWRWLPRDLGDRHVLVNAAAFLMYTYDKGRIVDRRKVIVGQEYHRTPMFSSAIAYSEFNPTWTVTPSIAGKAPQLSTTKSRRQCVPRYCQPKAQVRVIGNTSHRQRRIVDASLSKKGISGGKTMRETLSPCH